MKIARLIDERDRLRLTPEELAEHDEAVRRTITVAVADAACCVARACRWQMR
jgi:hypothetical protein